MRSSERRPAPCPTGRSALTAPGPRSRCVVGDGRPPAYAPGMDNQPPADADRDLVWRVLARTEVRDYRIFRSLAVRAAHPVTGAERDFTVLAVPDWVNVIALTPADDVVLIRQYRHGAEAVHVEIPGGMVDPGEDHAAAARRELAEETGYTAPTWRHLGVSQPNPAIHGNRLHTWLALDAEPTSARELDAGEVITVFTSPLAEVTRMLRDGRIDHALVLAAFAHLLVAQGELRRPGAM